MKFGSTKSRTFRDSAKRLHRLRAGLERQRITQRRTARTAALARQLAAAWASKRPGAIP